MAGNLSRRSFVAGVGGMLGMAALGPLAGCAPKAQGGSGYVPGTYTGTAPGVYGDVTVRVTVTEDAITAIEAVESRDTALIFNAAIDDLSGKIVAEQSLAVDATTGATLSSQGILNAVENALVEAGGNKRALTAALPEKEKAELPDETFDIVVVGAGGAGMAAAIQARRVSDCSVLLLEKAAYCGGSTALSGGQISVAGTSKNQEEGVLDFNADEYLEYFKKRAAEMDRRPDDMWINEALVRRIGERVPEFYGFLMDEGINQTYHENTAYFGEPGRGITGFKDKEKRGQDTYGRFLKELVEKQGAEIRTNSRVTDLFLEDGVVRGVKVETPEGSYTVHAKKVILSTGGFSHNRELFEEQNSYYRSIDKVWSYAAPGTTGDAFEFCAPLNPGYTGYGFIIMNACVEPYGFESPQGNYPCNGVYLWVDAQGKRFVDEGGYYYQKTFSVAELPEGYGWYLCSGDKPEGFFGDMALSDIVADLEPKGGAVMADTLEELAEKTGMDLGNLKESIAEDAERARAGAVDSFGYDIYQAVTDEGPYYAFKLCASVICTMYGFKLDDRFHVVDTSDQPIENLFAVGELTMGNYFFQEYVATSSAIACGVYGGSLAAEEAVGEILAS